MNTRSRAVMSMKNLKEDLDGILEIQTSSIPGIFIFPRSWKSSMSSSRG